MVASTANLIRSVLGIGVSPMTDLANNLNDTSLGLTPVQDSKVFNSVQSLVHDLDIYFSQNTCSYMHTTCYRGAMDILKTKPSST